MADNLSNFLSNRRAPRTRKTTDESFLEMALREYRDYREREISKISKTRDANPLVSRLLQSLQSTSWLEKLRTLEAIALFCEQFPDVRAAFQTNKVLPILMRHTIDDAAAYPGKSEAEQVRNYSLALISRWLVKPNPNPELQIAKLYISRKRLQLPPPLADEKVPFLLSQKASGIHLSSSSGVKASKMDNKSGDGRMSPTLHIITSNDDYIDSIATSEDKTIEKDTYEVSAIFSETRGCISNATRLLQMIVPGLQDVVNEETSETLKLNDDSIDGITEKDIKYDIKVEDEVWEDVPERDDVPKHDVPKHDEPQRDLTLKSADKVTLTSKTDIDKESSSSSPVGVSHSVVSDEATDAILSSIKDSVFLLSQVYVPQLVHLTVKSTESECTQMTKLIADAEHVIEVGKTVGIHPDVLKRARKRKL
jgi:hypothetical protein